MFLGIGLMLGMIITPYAVCSAASASVSLSTDKDSVTIGDKVIVSIQLSSEAVLGDFEAYISYNEEVLEFKNGASFIAGGEGLLKVSDTNVVDVEYSRKYVIEFNAKEIGNSDIFIKEKAIIYDYETGKDMSVSTNRIDIRVVPTKTASTNGNLKTLKISPSTLTPDFVSTITEYTTSVPYEIEELIISAIPEEEVAKVTIQGHDNLIVGSNIIKIKVKAESGDRKEYTINIVRDEQVSKEVTEGLEETDNKQEDSLFDQINHESSVTYINNLFVLKEGEDTYIQNGYRYLLPETIDDNITPEGYIKTTLFLNDITVNAYTPKDNLSSDYLLLYAINEQGEEGFYQYDRIEKTLQRYTENQNSYKTNKYIMTDEVMDSDEYKNKLTIMAVIIGILGAMLIGMSVALAHVYMKPRD